MKIAFHPAFSGAAPLADRYWRAAHYLGAIAAHITEFDIRTDLPPPAAPPDYLDPSITERVAPFAERVRWRPFAAGLSEADLVIVWDERCANDPVLADAAKVAVLDPAMLHEGDLWIELGATICAPTSADRTFAQAALASRCLEARADIAHVFGTGPGLGAVDWDALAPGASVVCNSIVKNAALMQRLRPALITAVDPIFHAGASRHAGAFRTDLAAALRAHDALFVAQERDVHLYRAALPEDVRSRIIGMPVRFAVRPNFDLAERFWVAATRNVLTLTLAPLAAQLGEEIRIYGCDGRPVSEALHFWNYDAASVFSTELEMQKRAHPGFYTLDYADYYALHCETVSVWVRALEQRGHRVRAMTPSHIPALNARAAPGVTRLPPPPAAFWWEAKAAYARRAAQSLYGAALNAPNAPGWLKQGLRRVVAGARSVVHTGSAARP